MDGIASELQTSDTDDPAIRAAILAALPPCTVIKRGAKGDTRFYRAPALPSTKRQWWDADRVLVFELLGSGQQTVVPPSIHPKGMAYQWLTPDTLENTAPSDLPELPADFVERMDDALAPLGCTRRKVASEAEAETSMGAQEAGDDDQSDPYRALNNKAIQNPDKWVRI